MPSISAISAFDDVPGAVPVSYLPMNVIGRVAKWFVAGNTSAGNRINTLSFDPRSASRPSDKSKFKLAFPKEVLVDGVYTVVGTSYASIDVSMHETFEEIDRIAFMQNLQTLINHPNDPLYKAVVDHEPTYG